MIVVHNICPECHAADDTRRVFTPNVFDKGSDTRCCFCGAVLLWGYYTDTVLPADTIVCNDKHKKEYPP